VWIRESTSVFAYPTILSAHAIGMGLAAGFNFALVAHVLGLGRSIPTSELRRFLPVMWWGFWLNAVSGAALLIAYPTKALTNPVFYVKMSLIAFAIRLVVVMDRRILRSSWPDTARPSVKALAIASLVSWTGAITAGRFLAYTYTRLFASW